MNRPSHFRKLSFPKRDFFNRLLEIFCLEQRRVGSESIMNGRFILEIPIYRVSPTKFDEETLKLRDKAISWIPSSPFSEDQKESMLKRHQSLFESSPEGRLWKYNEIIGYIILFADHRQIQAHCSLLNAKQYTRNMTQRKYFQYYDKVFTTSMQINDTSEIIKEKLREDLINLQRSTHFKKGWYIDLEIFDNLSPFIKWREITYMSKTE